MTSLAAWHTRGQFHDSIAGRLFYVREGEGEPLLMLHGFPTSSWDWHKVINELGQHFDCIAPDKLGYGFSDKPESADYSVSAHLDRILHLLESLGLQQVSLLTHDNGNSLTQEWLARQLNSPNALPVKLTRVCFLNGGLFPETHRARLGQRLLLSPAGRVLAYAMPKPLFMRSIAEVFGKNTQPSVLELNSYWLLLNLQHGQRLLHRHIRYIRERQQQRERWVGGLVNTDVPYFLIDGVQDPVSGGHMVQRYRQLLPKRLAIELDCGHFPQMEKPNEVVTAIREHWQLV
ncbi:MAG: alpha/beta hydrolase [Moraxellaceae bacterium]|nr:alpha/beta hydrolase [Moraxellaceae bacterium]MDZ4387769.1 alpha/beta hydrolase [Moraxellaceae bacterium]